MPKYMTKQRKLLTEYLRHHPDECISARAIADALQNDGISLSAVYRNLAALEAEGKVRRTKQAGASEVLYQYLDVDTCRNVLHLTCTVCGKTFHMPEAHYETIKEFLAKNEQFLLNESETVLYGICADCQKH
ncbi:MAG: transcriptional repressor [Peptococcaceae bacterium]|nr:transcriptional repressor [Peptococcaceae bacterium]